MKIIYSHLINFEEGVYMKKIIFIILILGSVFVFADKATEKIESEIKKIDKTGEKNAEKISVKKEKLEGEVEKLQSSYDIRAEKVEELRENSQVRWYRKEYKKILGKYEKVQNEEESIINKKNKELRAINKGLTIMDTDMKENINREVPKE